MITASGPRQYYAYSPDNRLKQADIYYHGREDYIYSPFGERVWRKHTEGGVTTEEVFFYGVDGKLLGTYSLHKSGYYDMWLNRETAQVYFAGKLVGRSQPIHAR